MTPTTVASTHNADSKAWVDLALFVAGLALAWWDGWQTTDLIWSLWLSSLVIGYAMICMGAFAPCVMHLRERSMGKAVYAFVCAVVTLVIFTFHFGLFHAGQAVFLNDIFAVGTIHGFPDTAFVVGVLQAYWPFVPLALLSERRHFHFPAMPPEPPRTSVKAKDIDARKARQEYGKFLLAMPYVNVARLHLLIFFLATFEYLQLNGIASYTLVYAAYFLPWRALYKLFGNRKAQP